MFLSLWIAGSAALGQYFSHELDKKQHERAEKLAALVKRETDNELVELRRYARLLATKGLIVQSVSEQDEIGVKQEILPLKSILQTDMITVIDRQKNVLLDSRQPVLQAAEPGGNEVLDLLLTGVGVSTILSSGRNGPPILVGTSPVKDQQGVAGGILIGIALSDDLLNQINESVQEQIIVLYGGEVVASTLEINTHDLPWTKWAESHDELNSITIAQQAFSAQTIHLKGLNTEHFDLVLLVSERRITQAKNTLWLFIVITAVLGATLTIWGGTWMARRIADPIQAITKVAHRVVEEGDFKLQAPVETQDEIGKLATALNQLIRWVEQYTHELEVAGQTLESRVEERTRELADTLEELQEMQAQLIQTEKMSSLGQMVAGIAHELNNPLSFIQGNIPPLNEYFQDLLHLMETYQHEYPQPTEAILKMQQEIDVDFMLEDLTKLLNSMKVGAQRVQDIVVSLRNYSRLDEAAIKDVDIHEGIENTLLLLNHRIKHKVEVIKHYGLLSTVRCSPAQLNQVFTNIIANALDALFEAEVDSKQLTIITCEPTANHVQICIRDNGIGIPPEVQAKIFDPFFTTKGVGKGTGLGLGICFKIIQQHRGKIEVDSEIGKGTEFCITLMRDAFPIEPVEKKPLAIAS
ncbi:MAG: ATP-binding protein [Leptolyngbyaceae cyanobacterium]